MIHIENMVKTYGSVRALDGLSLHVEPGAIYGFLGPNGAGKTTTLRILSGLARPDSGQAAILGQPAGKNGADQRRLIGVLPEEPAFYPWMTARECLRDLTAPLFGIPPRQAAQRTTELLVTLGLDEAADRRIAGFSRGMRQRLGLAQAMIHHPRVLLLDEPVSALDPAGRKDVLEQIGGLRGETTVLFSTHILADVERVCDRIGIIDHGQMIIESDRQALLDQYVLPIFEIESEEDPGLWAQQAHQLPGIEQVSLTNHTIRVHVKDIETGRAILLETLVQSGLRLRRFEIIHPSLEDIFLRLTSSSQSVH